MLSGRGKRNEEIVKELSNIAQNDPYLIIQTKYRDDELKKGRIGIRDSFFSAPLRDASRMVLKTWNENVMLDENKINIDAVNHFIKLYLEADKNLRSDIIFSFKMLTKDTLAYNAVKSFNDILLNEEEKKIIQIFKSSLQK